MKNLLTHSITKRSLLVLLIVVFLFGIASLFHPFRRDVRIKVQITLAHLSSPASTPFPTVVTTGLTPVQKRIVTINFQQYAKKPVSYDATVLIYTQGSSEAWCADYASWVYKQAGVPFSNPNSGSWRIPGVYTLEAYFQAAGRYKPAGTYQPKVGDVAIYGKGQGHTAIVLARHGSTITTIGGNESGRLRIDTRSELGKDNYDLLGFGTLNTQ